jgi:hypothetical protein
VTVTPVAPAAYPVADCATPGRLVLPVTEGIRYELVEGDGRTGPWTVVAHAEPGYQLAPDTPARFSGDLGELGPCTRLGPVTVAPADDLGSGRWRLRVLPELDGGPPRTLRVVVTLTRTVLYQHPTWPDGWTCPALGEVGIATPWHPVACTFDYDGTDPAALDLLLLPPLGLAPAEFLSAVLLYADDALVDSVPIADTVPAAAGVEETS